MPLLVYIIPKCGTIRSLIFYRTERIILIFVKVIVTYLSLFRNETWKFESAYISNVAFDGASAAAKTVAPIHAATTPPPQLFSY